VRRLLAGLLSASLAALGTAALSPDTAAARARIARTPLQVSIDTLSPSVIPTRGRVTLTGRITNRSGATWNDLNVYLLTSPEPLRGRAELAGAAASSAAAEVGGRRAGVGLFDKVGDLAPGESTSYRLSLSRADLGISGDPGVYWVGVHVLGAQDGGRDSVADGRARTFMPLLPPPGTADALRSRTRMALVLPFRQPVHRAGAARLRGIPGWNRLLAPDGRLDRLLSLSGNARRPLTWVVDPAVLDAARSVASGNPPLDTGPTDEEPSGGSSDSPGPSPSQGASPGSSPSGSPSGTPSGSPSEASSDAGSAGQPSALRAGAWLGEFARQAATHTVATVPYGDLDVAAVLGGPRDALYRRAAELSGATMAGLGVQNPLALVNPVNGYLSGQALRRVRAGTPVLLDGSVLPSERSSVVARPGRAPVVLSIPGSGIAGPGPNRRYDALAVRQRLLSEAALHALSADSDEPLVAELPPYWDPGPDWAAAGFFRGLETPWLQLVDLPDVLATAAASPGRTPTPVYPRALRSPRVPDANLLATRALSRTGGVFATVLSNNDTVDEVLAKSAMLGSSFGARAHPTRSRAETDGTTRYVRAQMSQVTIEGPQFVMMSGESGPIQVTLVNGLARTVTVGLSMATPGSDLRIAKQDPVTLGPGRRTSIRLEVRSDDIGVHSVTLRVTDANGDPLGSRAQLSVRTSHVSTIIWVIMGAGGALLFLAIAVRLLRRIRRRKSTHGPLLPRDPNHRRGQELKA
jgi:hypothetical protein